jgi:hypothetical protein
VRIRLLALTAAVAPLAALMIGTGSPALAAPGPNCGSYPAGQSYGIRANTNHITAEVVTVHKGATVLFTARIFRGGENCSGRLVVFFVHGPGEFVNGVAAYHRSGSAVTDGDGIAVLSKTAVNSFRWYAAYTSDNSTGIVSTRGGNRLVNVIP